jgi:hypothetical protein
MAQRRCNVVLDKVAVPTRCAASTRSLRGMHALAARQSRGGCDAQRIAHSAPAEVPINSRRSFVSGCCDAVRAESQRRCGRASRVPAQMWQACLGCPWRVCERPSKSLGCTESGGWSKLGCSYADVNLRRPADLPVHHSSENAQGTALPYCSTGRTAHASGPVAGMHACMRLRGKCAQASASECAHLSAYRHVRRWATQWSSWMDLMRASGRPRGRLHWRRGIGSAPQHKNSTACWLQHITTDCQRSTNVLRRRSRS